MRHASSWFSLIEILIGLVIVTMIMIAWFQALAAVGIAKVKLIETTKIEKEAYFSIERLFSLIKTWGTIDYEEYWNRYSYDTTYSSGHFLNDSDFWNQGTNYYCLSSSTTQMGTGWCLSSFNTSSDMTSLDKDFTNKTQQYNAYKKQFIDYNSDTDGDIGNEDGIVTWTEDFKGDDDDDFLGLGPAAFPANLPVGELYLINNSGNERTFFRWSVKNDPDAPVVATCSFASQQYPTGSGCLGTIEFLKLTWIDEGYDHGAYAWATPGWYWDDDGEIDTWFIHPDFDPNYATGTNPYGLPYILAGSGSYNYWQAIFPDTINVTNVAFYLAPNKNLEYSWKDTTTNVQIAPYLQLKMTLQPSWKEKRKIKGTVPQVDIATTIQLSNLDFK